MNPKDVPLSGTGATHIITITSDPSGTPNPVASGGTASLSVSATDSFGHTLTYLWSVVSCPGLPNTGSFNAATLQNPTWTASTNATGSKKTCTIQVTVSDGQGLIEVFSYFQGVSPSSPPASLAAAVLPTERTALVGEPAEPGAAAEPAATTVTAFATILNIGQTTAFGCAIVPSTQVPATFLYQTTDAQNALTGTANTPVDIPAGQGQTYVFAFTPVEAFAPTEVQLSFACTNSAPAPITPGVNTFRLRATTDPAPDPVALVAVGPPNDGILRLASVGAFAVATVNLGAPGLMTVTADTGGVPLPVSLFVCETDPGSGQCLAPPTPSVQTQMAGGATHSFGVFVSADTPIPFDPANHRIQVHLEGGGGGGGTSVAVCTVPLCP